MNKIFFGSLLLLFSSLLLIPLLACGPTEEPVARSLASGEAASPPEGAAVFRLYCVTCHGADGKLGLNGAKDLSASALSLEERMTLIKKGKGMMTPFEELLTPEEIRAVAEYTLEFKK